MSSLQTFRAYSENAEFFPTYLYSFMFYVYLSYPAMCDQCLSNDYLTILLSIYNFEQIVKSYRTELPLQEERNSN